MSRTSKLAHTTALERVKFLAAAADRVVRVSIDLPYSARLGLGEALGLRRVERDFEGGSVASFWRHDVQRTVDIYIRYLGSGPGGRPRRGR